MESPNKKQPQSTNKISSSGLGPKTSKHHHTNQAVRVILGLLTRAITPIEALLLRFFGIARQQSEKIAVKSSQSMLVVVASVFKAFGAAVQAGLSKPAMQRAMNKLFELVEEAQKL